MVDTENESFEKFTVVSWNNLIDEYRFVINNEKLMNLLKTDGYGNHIVSDINIFVDGNVVVSIGDKICYLHPYEILYLVSKENYLKIIDNDEKYLTCNEIASRLCQLSSFIPSVYLRYRQFRNRYICKMQSSFNGVYFSVYPDQPEKVHSYLLVCHKKGDQEIQAASRVFSSIKKRGLIIGTESPTINLNNSTWFFEEYTFDDKITDIYKDHMI